jgi:hypothetical protein
MLQAVEVLTALVLGVPALLREGLSWQDIRPERRRETPAGGERHAPPGQDAPPGRHAPPGQDARSERDA